MSYKIEALKALFLKRSVIVFILTISFSNILAAHADVEFDSHHSKNNDVIKKNIQIDKSQQLIIVTNNNKSSSTARVYTYERKERTWMQVFAPMPATIGKLGFATDNEKKEGDLKTPSGSFLIGTAFGYLPSVETQLSYRQCHENDYWINDVSSDSYNMWVKGKPIAKSYEKMRRKDNAYKYGIVIEYNTNPVVKGAGSAIFLHIWRGRSKPTLGCVAMSEANLLKMFKWLDKSKTPLIIMGVNETFGKDYLNKQSVGSLMLQ